MNEEQENRQSANNGADSECEAENSQKANGSRIEDNETLGDNTVRKILFSLCYIWGLLFFVPLIMYKDDEAKRHANAGLVLLLLTIAGNVVFGILRIIPVLRLIAGIVSGVYSALLLILGIIGIVYVVTDKNEPLPLIGKIRILK